jgi:hypothetical protein
VRLKRLDVVYSRRWRGWMRSQAGRCFGFVWKTQRAAIAFIRDMELESLRDHPGRRGVTIRIHRKDGRIREERTYPRSADPKRSRG